MRTGGKRVKKDEEEERCISIDCEIRWAELWEAPAIHATAVPLLKYQHSKRAGSPAVSF